MLNGSRHYSSSNQVGAYGDSKDGDTRCEGRLLFRDELRSDIPRPSTLYKSVKRVCLRRLFFIIPVLSAPQLLRALVCKSLACEEENRRLYEVWYQYLDDRYVSTAEDSTGSESEIAPKASIGPANGHGNSHENKQRITQSHPWQTLVFLELLVRSEWKLVVKKSCRMSNQPTSSIFSCAGRLALMMQREVKSRVCS